MKFLLIAKENCAVCIRAQKFLQKKELPFEVKYIGKELTREEVLELAPGQKTVPIIWVQHREDDVYKFIGTYEDLIEFLDKNQVVKDLAKLGQTIDGL